MKKEIRFYNETNNYYFPNLEELGIYENFETVGSA